jgi:hypothetical protein
MSIWEEKKRILEELKGRCSDRYVAATACSADSSGDWTLASTA